MPNMGEKNIIIIRENSNIVWISSFARRGQIDCSATVSPISCLCLTWGFSLHFPYTIYYSHHIIKWQILEERAENVF